MKKQRVAYTLVRHHHPARPTEAPLYYARAQARGVAGIREISERIDHQCTVTPSDIIAVLTALEYTVVEFLKNGEIVRLGAIGSIQVSVSSHGVASRKAFTAMMITRSHYVFRPGELLKNALKELSYEQVPEFPKSRKPELLRISHQKDKPEIKARSDIINPFI